MCRFEKRTHERVVQDEMKKYEYITDDMSEHGKQLFEQMIRDSMK